MDLHSGNTRTAEKKTVLCWQFQLSMWLVRTNGDSFVYSSLARKHFESREKFSTRDLFSIPDKTDVDGNT